MVAQAVEQPALVAGVAELESVLDSLDVGQLARLDDRTVRDLAVRVSRLKARLDGFAVAAARALDASGAARRAGATSTGDLLARDFGGNRSEGDRLVRTARSLEQSTLTEDALSEGKVSFAQAQVISDGLAKLPDGVTDDQRRLAERGLLKDAERLSLKDLRRRTDRAADAFAKPAEVDAMENDLLVDREARARANSSFAMWDKRDGTWEGRFRIPDAAAEQLKTALDGLAAPRRDHLRDEPNDTDLPVETATRMGHAFLELCSRLPTDKLPAASTLVVTLDYETLAGAVKPATLATGTRISAGQVRQLACNAGIIPAVLGGKSEILDLGRTARLHSPAQRTAIAIRDKGCTIPGCDRPPRWCEIHHRQQWAHGGKTDMGGVMICPHHHHTLHEQHWRTRFNPHDGVVEHQQPGDPTWRRNHRWRP